MTDETNFAYSTDPNYKPSKDDELVNVANDQQNLKVYLDRKNRKGKVVTVISGLLGEPSDFKQMEKKFKNNNIWFYSINFFIKSYYIYNLIINLRFKWY